MARCRCGSGKTYRRCCQPLHDGKPASSAEALMRSRYSAYAKRLVSYIQATTDPSGPQFEADREAWARSIEAFCDSTEFVGLRVVSASQDGDTASVAFEATLDQGGRVGAMREKSSFNRVDGRWLYHSGEPL